MELVPYLLCIAAGFVAGVVFELRYGAQASADVASAKETLAKLKDMLPK